MTHLLRVIAALLSLSACLSACAMPPDPDVRAIVHEDTEGRRTPLLDPRGMPIYDDLGHGLQPQITVERKGELGYDLVLDFENTTDEPVGLGRVQVGVVTLGPEFSWLNLNRRCVWTDDTRRDFTPQVRHYPFSFYAPVGVIRNDDFVVGASLLYDVLQDRHEVTVRITKPGGIYNSGPGGAGFGLGFDLGDDSRGQGYVGRSARLAPGEQRQYRVAVRAMRLDRPVTDSGPQEWLEVVEPYRRHFEAMYGGVSYERDTRPVRAWHISGSHALGADNPMGYHGGSRGRPDLAGWGPTLTKLMRPTGFERTMLWAPGGMHRHNRELNFPSRFMSQNTTSAKLATVFNEQTGLPRLARSGHEVGLWWGRATRVLRQWDSPNWEPLDLRHPDRVDLAMAEMRLADQAGARAIGLDAFTIEDMPVWQQYEWVLGLRQLYPDTTFIIEPLTCDVMHSLGPTFAESWLPDDRQARPETRYRTRNPNYLADFLLPGHEIWGHFRYDVSPLTVNATRVQRDAEYLAATGRVPVLATREPLLNPAQAAAQPTWLRTVPDRLKTDAHRSATPFVLSVPPADDGGDDGSDGGGNDEPRDKDDPIETRSLTLPNGRVIQVPVYSR